MKKKVIKSISISVVFLLLAAAYIVRVMIVNGSVPESHEYRYAREQAAKVGDFSVLLLDAQVVDQTHNPDGLELQDGSEIVQCTLDVTYTGTEEYDTFSGITCILMSGAWRNGQNYSYYMKTNRENLNIKQGETKKIVFYFLLNRLQFSENQYQKRFDRDYSIVFSTYPDAVMIDLGRLK